MDKVLTVSQVNGYFKSIIDTDVNIKSIFISGEISNFTNHIKTGHFYFTLKDEKASIKAVMFKGNTLNLRFLPENGMKVIIFGSVNFFERDGICQIICADMQPEGIGKLFLAFEQLKEKLAKQGLFDESHKKPIPKLPLKIAVVTANTGAAIHDIINVLSRRYPIGEIVIIPTLVQGENASLSICDGIEKAQRINADVMIVGRGGGSIEDLWAFNDERVALSIYNSSVPVISAVGHEVDYTISDFVADLRAPTPSAAAELVAPSVADLSNEVSSLLNVAKANLQNKLWENDNKIKMLKERLMKKSPVIELEKNEKQLDMLKKYLIVSLEHQYERKASDFGRFLGKLETLSPLKVLTRGYSITFSDNKTVTSIEDINEGDEIATRLTDGMIYSTVLKKEKKG